MIIVSTVLALSIGTALAENKPADKGDDKGQQKQATNKSTAAKGQENQAANKGTTAKNKATDKGEGKEQNQGTSYAFKGTVAQNGTDGGPLEIKVEKANDVAQS